MNFSSAAIQYWSTKHKFTGLSCDKLTQLWWFIISARASSSEKKRIQKSSHHISHFPNWGSVFKPQKKAIILWKMRHIDYDELSFRFMTFLRSCLQHKYKHIYTTAWLKGRNQSKAYFNLRLRTQNISFRLCK